MKQQRISHPLSPSDKVDTSKIIYHSVILLDIITEEKCGLSPTSTKPLPGWTTPYSYHDYIHTWFKFMLHQDENMKWMYVKEGDVLTRKWFVKWWDKFSHTQDVIDNVT